jgi:two-component system sensor histidine kinase CpxA
MRNPFMLRSPLRSLYAKIFLWFCLTVLGTLVAVLAAEAVTGTQPFGRRWMSVTQDLYAHSAVDFYRTGGPSSLARYMTQLETGSGIHGQLLDGDGNNVLGRPLQADAAVVTAQARTSGTSRFRLGRVWSAASPVAGQGERYTFVMVVYPERGVFDRTFVTTMLPRLILCVLLVSVFCLLLARHITRPILILEDAATQLAAGDLTVRAGPAIAPRRDELARMATAFDRMAERIQRLISAQQEMLGHISHELRSPLTRIVVSLELLRRADAGTPGALLFDQMQLDLDRLDRMIGQILGITRMDIQGAEAGFQVARHAVALGPMLDELVKDAAFEAQSMHKRVALEVESEATVLGDEALLRSCCENVLRNALLYTPEGATIQVRLTQGKESTAVVLIEDDGPGVPDESLPRLFDLFYRVGEAQQKHPEGTGFGLAIAQRIVAMHGGTIAADNRRPHGLAVRIALPLAAEDASA